MFLGNCHSTFCSFTAWCTHSRENNDEHGLGTPPTVDEVLDVLKMEEWELKRLIMDEKEEQAMLNNEAPDGEDEEARKNREAEFHEHKVRSLRIMRWWHDDVMPSQAKTWWETDVRHFQTLNSKVTLMARDGEQIPDKARITPTAEAHALLVLECHHHRWLNTLEFKEKNPGKKLPTAKKDPEGKHQSKWTTKNDGSSDFGGIKPPGIKRFKELIAEVREIHANRAEGAKNELFCELVLQFLREKNQITADSHEDHKRARGKAKKPEEEDEESEAPSELDICDD